MLYDSTIFTPFDFSVSLKRIFSGTLFLCIKNNFFICLKENLNALGLENSHYIDMTPSFLNEKSIVVGKIKQLREQSISLMDIEIFNRALLAEEMLWIDRFLLCIHDHLNARESQGSTIAGEAYIKIEFSKIYADIQILKLVENGDEKTPWASIFVLIKNTVLSLAKLAGARAFLKNNVIEMLLTFEIMNQIYWV